jgi:ribonuclease R
MWVIVWYGGREKIDCPMKKKKFTKHRSRAAKAAKRQGSPTGKHSSRSERGKSRRHPVLVGRVQKNPRGFAFLIPVASGFADVYVSPREAATLMNGDVVEFHTEHRGRRTEAVVDRIVQRGQSEVLGEIRETEHGMVLVTSDGDALDLDGARARDDGQFVIATIEEYPTDRHPGLVAVKEHLGSELSPRHDITIAISRYGLPDTFGLEAQRVADKARARAEEEIRRVHRKDHSRETAVPRGHPGSRRDQRDLPYVTIDGEDAKDFDDAVLVETPRQGAAAFILYVAIADVSFFVEPGSALDREARTRGTSVYFPGFCLPMLPESLSNDMCSLRPQSDRLAFTAEIHFDRDARAIETRFYPSVIRTARRCTYTEIQGFLDGVSPHDRTLEDLAGPINRMHELYLKLAKQRAARGVLDFDLPESKIETDPSGRPTVARRADRYDAHRLIEEFMIAANRAVAARLRESRSLTLYRVHEAPDLAALEELNTVLRNMGVSAAVRENSPKAFARVLEATKHLPIAPTLHQVILRLQKQAHYEPEPKGHFGLALRDYAHFTSPIRRYPDLVVHRSLRALIEGQRSAEPVEAYFEMGEQTSRLERRAMEAERFVVRRKQCWFMQGHLGQRFDGIISGVSERGLFVELPRFGLDGFVPLEFLRGDYQLDERHLCLRRRPGNQLLKVGDPFRIEVAKVSVDEGQITFAPDEGPTAPDRARSRVSS